MPATVQIDESNLAGETVTNNISTGNYRGANDSPNLADPLDDPIQITANSFEKWHRARWSSGAASRLDTWRHYKSDGAVVANTDHDTSADSGTPSNPTYATPTTATSTVATFDIPTADPAVQTIVGELNATGERTAYVVTQIQIAAGATVGDLDGEITWAWREIA